MAGMQPRDVYALTGVADPRLSPDGRRVAYVVRGIDGDANEYSGAIWLAETGGAGDARQFTSGVKRDLEPRWSPDGTRLAFVSNRDGETMQLYVVPVEGGEARRLSALKEDVAEAVWSPDGTQLAFVARVRDAEYDEEDPKRRRPRRFSRLSYKLEHVGWTVDRPQHLFVVPADGSAEPRQLTSGDFEDGWPAWSPDGTTIAFVSARHPDWDLVPVNDVYLVDAGGGEPRRLTQGGGQFERLSWAPDGTTIAGLRYPGVLDDPKHVQVAVVDGASGGIQLADRVARPQLRPVPVDARADLG